MELSVILVHYNDQERLVRLLHQLPQALAGIEAEVIVVENGSGIPGLREVFTAAFAGVLFIQNEKNLGFAGGVNTGVAHARGRVLCILNPDVELRLPFFPPLLAALQQPGVGVVGPRVLRPDGRVQLTAHKRFPTLRTVFVEYCLPLQVLLSRFLSPLHPHDESTRSHAHPHATRHLTGVCLVTLREVYNRTGGLDANYFLYIEETDWQRRLAAERLTAWLEPTATLTHYGSIGKRFAQASPEFLSSLFRYWRTWKGHTLHLRLVLALAALGSLATLLVGWIVSLARSGLRPKLALYTGSFFRILGFALTHRPREGRP